MTETEKKTRPYWHVDAKWIFGIIFAISLSCTLLFFSLYVVTAEKPATDALTLAIATAFSRNGLDNESEIIEMKAKYGGNPDAVIQPIPTVNISVSLKEIEGMSPRETRLFFFRKLAGPIYTGSTEGLTNDPELQKKFLSDTKMLRLFASAESHKLWNQVFIVSLVVSILCLVPFVLFSHRFGKLVGPGIVISFVSFWGAAFFGFATTIKPPVSGTPSTDSGPLGGAGVIIGAILPDISRIVFKAYIFAYLLGICLLISALIGKIIYKIIKKKDKSSI